MKYELDQIKFEVGDWVVQTEPFSLFPTDFGAHKVVAVQKDMLKLENEEEFLLPCDKFRAAGQKEVAKAVAAAPIFIGEYLVEFIRNADKFCTAIKVGCQVVDKDMFLRIGKRAGWINT